MWPFASIMSTVILSNVDEALSSEGYEFGGYLFFPEEMKAFGQFKGSKLQRYDSKPLLGIKNGNSAFSSKANYQQSTTGSIESNVADNHKLSVPSNGTINSPIRPKEL